MLGNDIFLVRPIPVSNDELNSANSPRAAADNMGELTVAANVIEEMIERELVLSEWQKLDDLVEGGCSEQQAVKEMMAFCAKTAPEELLDCSSLSSEAISQAVDDGIKSGDLPSLTLEGHAVVIAGGQGNLAFLENELSALGLHVHGVDDPKDLVRPLRQLLDLSEPVDFVFIAESFGGDKGDKYCAELLSLGKDHDCAIFLIDEERGLLEDWDAWPLSGVLSTPFGPREICSVLADVR